MMVTFFIFREEVEATVKSLKKRRTSGINNTPGELIIHDGESATDMLIIIWQSGARPTTRTQSLIMTLPKKSISNNLKTTDLSV